MLVAQCVHVAACIVSGQHASNSRVAFQGNAVKINRNHKRNYVHFFYGGGWNQGPLDTAATSCPIVSAPGDYDNGEIGGMIGSGS
jgi:hypothetical protein